MRQSKLIVSKEIWFTFEVPMLHRWPEAEGVCDYLANPHRHVFKFKVWAKVDHNNRALEFITEQVGAKIAVEGRYAELTSHGVPTMSCEDWAEWLLNNNPAYSAVEVSEDGENGALIVRTEFEELNRPAVEKVRALPFEPKEYFDFNSFGFIEPLLLDLLQRQSLVVIGVRAPEARGELCATRKNRHWGLETYNGQDHLANSVVFIVRKRD